MQTGRLKCGTKVGDNLVLDNLVDGGMAEVYLAFNSHINSLTCLKLLPECKVSEEKTELLRFKEEVKIMQVLDSFDNPCIAKYCGSGKLTKKNSNYLIPWLATEFISGCDLEANIYCISPQESVSVVFNLASALECTETARVVHRDIKPANVRLNHAGLPVLIDLGLNLREDRTRFTAKHSILGTLDYIAPEQLIGGSVDNRTDIYQLGVLFYAMLTKNPLPLPKGNLQDKFKFIVSGYFNRPSEIMNFKYDISNSEFKFLKSIDNIILKMLEKNPNHRFQSAKELKTALSGIYSDVRLKVKYPFFDGARFSKLAKSSRVDKNLFEFVMRELYGDFIFLDLKKHKMPREGGIIFSSGKNQNSWTFGYCRDDSDILISGDLNLYERCLDIKLSRNENIFKIRSALPLKIKPPRFNKFYELGINSNFKLPHETVFDFGDNHLLFLRTDLLYDSLRRGSFEFAKYDFSETKSIRRI